MNVSFNNAKDILKWILRGFMDHSSFGRMSSSPTKQPLVKLFNIDDLGAVTSATDGTQLADSAPQLDIPQRIAPPNNVKTPDRIPTLARDDRLRDTMFVPRAIGLSNLQAQFEQSHPSNSKLVSKLACCSGLTLQQPKQGVSAKQLKEYAMLAESSKRSGRHDAECASHLCLGILHDNVGEHLQAVDCYLLVLSISESTQQSAFTQVAHNCLGVDYMFLAASASRQYTYTGEFVSKSAHLVSAQKHHAKHLELADDAGKFVANLNLGLTCASLGDPNKAASHYQEALRLAIRLDSSYGQSLAVGNLGLLAMRQNDLQTAKSCMEQHLQLIQTVVDKPAEAFAWMQIGLLASHNQDYDRAVRAFDQAYMLAQELGESSTLKQCSCYLGVARGKLQMQESMQKLFASVK